jgi:hypothetical protein
LSVPGAPGPLRRFWQLGTRDGRLASMPLELLRTPVWEASGAVALLLMAAVVYFYLKQRNEKKRVYGLLAFLWGRRVLYSSLYQEHPVAALESVRGIQKRLRADLERLPNGSKAFWPVREMHEACLGFLAQTEPLTRVEPVSDIGETELLSDKWVGGIHWRMLENSLIRLRSSFSPLMEELYEEFGIEKPPRVLRRVHAAS